MRVFHTDQRIAGLCSSFVTTTTTLNALFDRLITPRLPSCGLLTLLGPPLTSRIILIQGVAHSTAGYLLMAMLTHKYVFDYRPGDVYACVADLGWITGHSYILYGPLANGATTPMYPGEWWRRYYHTHTRILKYLFYFICSLLAHPLSVFLPVSAVPPLHLSHAPRYLFSPFSSFPPLRRAPFFLFSPFCSRLLLLPAPQTRPVTGTSSSATASHSSTPLPPPSERSCGTAPRP